MNYYQQPSQLALPIIKLLTPIHVGECRQVIYHMERYYNWGFNMSSALKYLWRLGVKSDDVTSDLSKAIQYMQWELQDSTCQFLTPSRTNLEKALLMCQNMLI